MEHSRIPDQMGLGPHCMPDCLACRILRGEIAAPDTSALPPEQLDRLTLENRVRNLTELVDVLTNQRNMAQRAKREKERELQYTRETETASTQLLRKVWELLCPEFL